jgi:hypothetical protein
MQKVAADINFLKQDESLTGGSAHYYLADTLLKIVTRGKLDPDKEFGIKGFYAEVVFVKSRSSAAGRPFTMVYDQTYGFNNVYTNFNFLKDCKKVSGGGKGYYLEGAEDVKFTQKEFEEKLDGSKKLDKAYWNLLEGAFENLVP